MNIEEKKKKLKDLESIIAKAIKKVGATKENELCKFIPLIEKTKSGERIKKEPGYLHHFTLKSWKTKKPKELLEAIQEHIINKDKPKALAPKPRAPRGFRNRKDQFILNQMQKEELFSVAKRKGYEDILEDIVYILSPKKSLAAAKRELISSIRKEVVNEDLWKQYKEALSTKNTPQKTSI